MPNTRISDLSPAITVAGTDVYPSVQTAGVGPVKTSLTQITNYALANAAAGSVGAPSIAPTGDTNTGFWFPAADTIAASTAGSERLRINSAGNVGIGTQSPTAKLDITVATGYAIKFAQSSTFAYIAANNEAGSANVDLNIYCNNQLFSPGGTEKMRITSAGIVGVGITPSSWDVNAIKALQVVGANFAGDNGGTYRARVLANAYYNSGYIYQQSNYATMYAQDSANGQHQWFISASGTAGNAITFTQAMTLANDGALGLGVAPSANSGSYSLGISSYTKWGVPSLSLGASATDYGMLGYNVGFTATTNTYKYLAADVASAIRFNGGQIQFLYTGTAGVAGNTLSLSEAMRITIAGNIHTPAGSTGMTNGFFYMPAAAGAPSGTPTAITGTVPFYYNTTNDQFYVYNGAWKKVTLA